MQRYDKMLIKDSMLKKDSSGYLTVNAPITRPGVFPYQRQDGTIQMEAKLPDDVFSDLAIYSARAKPVTDNHPNEAVTMENVSRYSKGMSHTDSRIEGGKLVVSLTVTDANLIEKIYSGEQSEISIGFMSDIVEQSGTYQGDQYGYVQQNIDINHIAIVEQGRAGPEVAIRADSDAWQIEDKGGNSNMPTYKIDGKEFEVPSEVKSFLDAQKARLDSANTKASDYDAMQGKHDALETQLQARDAELEEAKKNQLSADELDKQVEARVELISGAKTLLGDSFEFTGKSEREIKEAVITKTKPEFKGDGKSDDYVNAFYDATLGQAKQDGFSSYGTNHLFSGDSSNRSDTKIQEMKNQRLNMNATK